MDDGLAGTRMLGSPRRGRVRPTDAVALVLVALLLLLTLRAITDVTIYASADAGHYLADGDSLFGDGVREIRHLPAFPFVVAVFDALVADSAAIQGSALVLVAVLFAGFYLGVRGKFGSSVAEAVGGLAYAGSSVMAEGIGWFGGATLLGLALLPVTVRTIDDALVRGGWRVAAAAVLCGLAALCHPLTLALTALGGFWLAAAALWRAYVSRGVAAARVVAIRAAVIGGAAVVALAAVSNVVFSLESPTRLAFSADQLSLVWTWAFRENAPFWIGLIVVGMVGPTFARFIPASSRRLARVMAGLGATGLVGALVLVGNESYTTRTLYVLALPAALGATWLISWLESTFRTRGRAIVAMSAVVVSALVVVGFEERLGVAVPYYNEMTTDELRAMEFLRAESATTVLVTARGADRNAGTLYSWLVEGFAEHRAAGPGRPYLFLIDAVRAESLDAERALAGTDVLEGAGARVGLERSSNIVTAAVEHDGDWIPLLNLWFPSRDGSDPGPRALDPASRRVGALPDDAFEVRVGTTDSGIRLTVAWDASSVGMHVIPSRALPASTPTEGNGIEFHQVTNDGPVTTRATFFDDGGQVQFAHDRTWTIVTPATEGRQEVVIDVDGPTGARGGFTAYSADVLYRQLGVTHVLTWRESEEDSRLADRPCHDLAFANRTMHVYRIDQECIT